MNKLKKRSDCPISCSLDIWGDKWSLLIIRDLLRNKRCTYGDFLKSPEKIATNILANRLQKLEENGIILKQNYPENKTKALYTLTTMGIHLFPILVEITLWADKYLHLPPHEELLPEEAHVDKVNYIQATLEKLKKEITSPSIIKDV